MALSASPELTPGAAADAVPARLCHDPGRTLYRARGICYLRTELAVATVTPWYARLRAMILIFSGLPSASW